MDLDAAQKLITAHEGVRYTRYFDQMKIPTIGVGANLLNPGREQQITDMGLDYQSVLNGTQSLNDDQVNAILQSDLNICVQELTKVFPNLDTLPDNASTVLLDLMFNLGYNRFSQFHLFIAAVNNSDWTEAQNQLRNSAWAREVPTRCASDCSLLSQIQ